MCAFQFRIIKHSDHIFKQEILSDKMSENLKLKTLFDCCLLTEVHFVFKHNNFWNDNSNKCDSCHNSFENNINLSQHIKNFHNHRKRYTDVIFALGNCFDRKKQLQIYTNNFHKALKGNYCGKLFTNAGHNLLKVIH